MDLAQIKPGCIKRLVVIDGTWRQARAMLSDSSTQIPAIKQLPRVKISSRKSVFWRFQNKNDEHLATIEAIYYFYRDFHGLLVREGASAQGEGRGDEYDNLLFFFKLFYERIQLYYNKNREKCFNSRHQNSSYIQYH